MNIKKKIIVTSNMYICSILSISIYSIYNINNYDKMKKDIYINMLKLI